jgi:hypothetical protein
VGGGFEGGVGVKWAVALRGPLGVGPGQWAGGKAHKGVTCDHVVCSFVHFFWFHSVVGLDFRGHSAWLFRLWGVVLTRLLRRDKRA